MLDQSNSRLVSTCSVTSSAGRRLTEADGSGVGTGVSRRELDALKAEVNQLRQLVRDLAAP